MSHLSHGRVDNRFQTKLVTVNFQSLKTGQSQLQIEHPQLISADGKHKPVEAIETTIKAFPQANLMQAFKKLEVKNIFAAKNKKKKARNKKETGK